MSRKSKGIALHHLSASAQTQALAKLAAMDQAVAVVKESLTPEPANQWAPYRNKTEWRAAQWLAARYPAAVHIIRYEELKLCVGTIDGKPAYYTPDFLIPWAMEPWLIFEVKGGHRWRRHGIERLRAAAARWPMFDWYLVEPVDGGFSIKEVEG